MTLFTSAVTGTPQRQHFLSTSCPVCDKGMAWTPTDDVRVDEKTRLQRGVLTCPVGHRFDLKVEVTQLHEGCRHGDELCPCQDGDSCHYESIEEGPRASLGAMPCPRSGRTDGRCCAVEELVG